MDLADLHIFRSVVQAGGITRAAEKLNRVQSNITTRVRQLEAELGVDLFVREGKRLHLSSAGKLLLDYADRLIDLAQEAREAVHDAKPRGLLRLGTGESTAAMRLPVPMNEYLARYPDVSLELRTGNTRQLAAEVLGGELDAALTSDPVADAPFEKVPIYEEELVIIATAGHPPIKSPRDARSQTVLAFESGCSYRQRLEDWFAHHGEMPERIVEITSYHAMLGCRHGHFTDAAQRAHHLSRRQTLERAFPAAGARAIANQPNLAQRYALAEGARADRDLERALRPGQEAARRAQERGLRSRL